MEKLSRDYKIALCIKNGKMLSGKKFCRKGVLYEYYLTSGSNPYNVKSENQNFHNHSMCEEFFSKYFTESWIWPENENDLFEI